MSKESNASEKDPSDESIWLDLRRKARRLLESLSSIPRIYMDKKAWENEHELVFNQFRRGCLDAANNRMLEAPIYDNRQIEDAWLFLIEISRQHANRRKHVQECTRPLGSSYNWSMVLNGSKKVHAALLGLSPATRKQVLEGANAVDILEALDSQRPYIPLPLRTEQACPWGGKATAVGQEVNEVDRAADFPENGSLTGGPANLWLPSPDKQQGHIPSLQGGSGAGSQPLRGSGTMGGGSSSTSTPGFEAWPSSGAQDWAQGSAAPAWPQDGTASSATSAWQGNSASGSVAFPSAFSGGASGSGAVSGALPHGAWPQAESAWQRTQMPKQEQTSVPLAAPNPFRSGQESSGSNAGAAKPWSQPLSPSREPKFNGAPSQSNPFRGAHSAGSTNPFDLRSSKPA